MISALRSSILLSTALLAMGIGTGCRVNSAKLTTQTPFAELEDTVQQSVRLEDSRERVLEVAKVDWRLAPEKPKEGRESILTFALAPKIEGTLGKSRHRAWLSFEFGQNGLMRATYANYSPGPEIPHGVSEIGLWRPRQ